VLVRLSFSVGAPNAALLRNWSAKSYSSTETTSPPAKINYLLACVGLFPILVEHQYADTICVQN